MPQVTFNVKVNAVQVDTQSLRAQADQIFDALQDEGIQVIAVDPWDRPVTGEGGIIPEAAPAVTPSAPTELPSPLPPGGDSSLPPVV